MGLRKAVYILRAISEDKNSHLERRDIMGNAVHDKESQVEYLKHRLNMFLEVIDSMDPEQTDLEDIDRLIQMIDDLEFKCEQFKK